MQLIAVRARRWYAVSIFSYMQVDLYKRFLHRSETQYRTDALRRKRWWFLLEETT